MINAGGFLDNGINTWTYPGFQSRDHSSVASWSCRVTKWSCHRVDFLPPAARHCADRAGGRRGVTRPQAHPEKESRRAIRAGNAPGVKTNCRVSTPCLRVPRDLRGAFFAPFQLPVFDASFWFHFRRLNPGFRIHFSRRQKPVVFIERATQKIVASESGSSDRGRNGASQRAVPTPTFRRFYFRRREEAG